MRKKWLVVVLAVLSCVFAAIGLVGCTDAGGGSGKPFSEEKDGVYAIGLEKDQRWRFSAEGELLGADIYTDGQWEQVLAGGTLFVSSVLDAEAVSVTAEEGAALRIAGENWEAVYSFSEDSPFLKRAFTWTFPADTEELPLGAMCFYLNTAEEKYLQERGFIGSYSEADTGMNSSVYIMNGLPAIYSNVFNDAESLAVSVVLDREATSAAFQLACRFFNQSRGSARLGFYSAAGTAETGEEYSYVDHVELSDGETTDYYDQLGMIRSCLTRISPLDFDALAASDNKTVQDYDTLAVGLVNELLDERAVSEQLLYSFVPYAYSTGWGESFTSLMILRGLVKYAAYTGDAQLMAETEQLALAFTRTVNGRSWIEDLGFGPFLHYSYAGSFSDGDNPEMGSNLLGTFKYFDRVNALGEIALYTGNEQIADAFMSLVPLIREHLVGEEYYQPVSYSLATLEPYAGTDRGGSAGGAAIWGHINYLAYALTDGGDPLHETYLSDAVGSLKRAANLGFEQMWAIRDAPKPTSVGWTVRGLLSCYEETGEEELLRLAERTVKGLYHFYYYGNDPYITFGSGGLGIACSSEHWEAFMEFGQGLWLSAGILNYSAEKEILDLYASAYYAGLWFFPVNLGGISTHSNANFYEWAESMYVPFEFAGGRLNDPALAAGDQSIYRLTKEVYGAGELFNLHMLFEAYGKSTNRLVVVCSPTAVSQRASQTEQTFRLYNASSQPQKTTLLLRGFGEGTYTLVKDGKTWQTLSAAQMRNGIALELAAGETFLLRVEKSSSSSAAEAVAEGSVSLAQTEGTHNSASFTASGVPGAASYLLEVSSSSAFGADTKTYYAADGAFRLSFADGKTIFVRAAALTADGRATAYSQTLQYAADGVITLADDDFSSVSGWTAVNTDLRSDGVLGIMNILAGDIGYGVSSIEKTFTVTLSEGVLFEFIPYGKVPGSRWDLTLSLGGTQKTLVSEEAGLGGGYVFAMEELFPGVSGERQVTVRLDVKGYNRSFMIERVRFVKPVENSASRSYENLLAGAFAGELQHELRAGSLVLSNENAGETYFRTFTTQAIDLGGSAPVSYFRITLSGARILDRVQVQIWDTNQSTKYYESVLNVSTGLVLDFDANGSGRLAAYPSGARQYVVKIAPVSGAEQATVVSAFAGAKADYSDAANVLAPSVSAPSVSVTVTSDLSQNGYLVFDADMAAGGNAAWKLYVRDTQTGAMAEMRIPQEIEGFASAEDYANGVNNGYYFREKAGLFVYDLRAIMGAVLGEEAVSGERSYEFVIEVSSGSMQVNQFYLTNANARAAVCA